MQINNRFIQDMHMFQDPSHIPIVIVEHIMNTFSENSYLKNVDLIGGHGPSSKSGKQLPGASPPQQSRDLKVVVFVHGFQASPYSHVASS